LKKIDIFKNKTTIDTRNIRIIYFLTKKDVVVYVGQSSVGVTRIYHHIVENKKDFDAFSYIAVDENDDLDTVEAHYIIKFNPIYNMKIHGNKYYKSLDTIKKLLGVSKWEINKIIRNKGINPVFHGIYDVRDFSLEVK
jgi:hypothetical protein